MSFLRREVRPFHLLLSVDKQGFHCPTNLIISIRIVEPRGKKKSREKICLANHLQTENNVIHTTRSKMKHNTCSNTMKQYSPTAAARYCPCAAAPLAVSKYLNAPQDRARHPFYNEPFILPPPPRSPRWSHTALFTPRR